MKWERRGLALSLLALIAAIVAIVLLARRERGRPRTERVVEPVDARAAPWIAAVGVAFVALTGLAVLAEWFGLPSRLPSIWFSSDPYNLDTVFAGVAVGLLGLSVVVRMVEHVVRRGRPGRGASSVPNPAETSRPRRTAAVAAGISAMALFISGCNVTGGNANQALSNAQKAGAISPDIEGATLLQARLDQTAKDAARCVAQYTVALRTYETLVSAYVGRGNCYESGGLDYAGAVHDFTRALALSPDSPYVLLDRASADQGTGNLAGAGDDYQAAATVPSATPEDVLNAVDGLLAIGLIPGAQSVLQVAMSRFPNDPLVLSAASDAALANGDDQQALDYLSRASQAAMTSTDAYAKATALSRSCGYQVDHAEFSAALTSCAQAAIVSQDGSGAFDNLSAAHAELGDLSQAIADMTDAIGAFQGNVGPGAQPSGVDGFGLSYLLEAQGRLYVEAHQAAKAIADYERAKAALPPGSPDFAARLRGDIRAAKAS